ncbi:MAG: MarR family transcriptional regulator [Clostridiales bacterium]|jgi:DNA-binding MarR family transcriptional regulator|nr:MarR family transcriptional regulator [Clostridiales bacterium]
MNEFESNLNELLVKIFNFISRYEEKSLKAISKTPVTVTEAHILEIIACGGATVSEIAAALSVAVPTATVAVKKLENKCFVTKTASTLDARRFIIELTPEGARINRAHSLFHRKMIRYVSAGLSDSEKEALISAVKKLRDFFREKVEV